MSDLAISALSDAPAAGARAQPADRAFSGRERFLLGAFGACIPLLLNTAYTDRAGVFADPDAVAVFFWAVRVAILAACGGLLAWRLRGQQDLLTLLQVGIGTPALVSTWLAGTAAQQKTAAVDAPAPAAHASLPRASAAPDVVALLTFATPAHAAAPAQEEVLSFRQSPPESFFAAARRGLTGRDARGDRFVYLAEAHPAAQAAAARAAEVARSTGMQARVFAPDGPVQGFAVVLGAWLQEEDAGRLRDEAAARGLRATVWQG